MSGHADVIETRKEINDAFRRVHTTPRSRRERDLVKLGVLEGGTQWAQGWKEGFEFARALFAPPPKRLK